MKRCASLKAAGCAGLMAFLLGGCDQEAVPISQEYSDFVGVWESGVLGEGNSYRFLQVTASGYVTHAHWQRQGNSKSCVIIDSIPVRTLSASLIHGSAFWVINVELVVDSPPKDTDGVMRMTVEGEELIRTDDRQEGLDFDWDCVDGGLAQTPLT